MEVTRGPVVESRYRGFVAALAGDGEVVARLGDTSAVTYLRSSSKPHQALPLITAGAADRFDFTPRELAVACGSHNGEPAHVGAVRSMLRKAGLDESALRCGPQEPYSKKAAEELRARGREPADIHNNCSGKHAGMLALAVHLGAPVETYLRPEHPVQRMMADSVARFSGVPAAELIVGVDGCGVPTFGLSVKAMAQMFARFVAPPAEWEEGVRRACRRIVEAMNEHPEMVEGDGELDTELMRRGRGRLISKVGAEGVYAAAVLPSAEWPHGLGAACKIEEGDKGDRARPPAAVELLRQLGALGAEDLEALAKFARSDVRNKRGETVGEVRARFSLGLARA